MKNKVPIPGFIEGGLDGISIWCYILLAILIVDVVVSFLFSNIFLLFISIALIYITYYTIKDLKYLKSIKDTKETHKNIIKNTWSKIFLPIITSILLILLLGIAIISIDENIRSTESSIKMSDNYQHIEYLNKDLQQAKSGKNNIILSGVCGIAICLYSISAEIYIINKLKLN